MPSAFLGNNGPVVVIGAGFGIVTLGVIPGVVVILIRYEDNAKLGYNHCPDNLDLIKIMGDMWLALEVLTRYLLAQLSSLTVVF